MKTWIKDAIKYVKENKTWSDAEEALALDRMNELRCDLSTAYDKIFCAIHDLMEEYCDINELEFGSWMWEIDEDKVFMLLDD